MPEDTNPAPPPDKVTATPANIAGSRQTRELIAVGGIVIIVLIIAYYIMSGSFSSSSRYVVLASQLSSGKPVSLREAMSTLNFSTNVATLEEQSLKASQSAGSALPNLTYEGKGSISGGYAGVNLDFPFSFVLQRLSNGPYSKSSVNMKIFHQNISTIVIVAPNFTFVCGDQNQSLSVLSSLLGSSGYGTAKHPENRCTPQSPINQSWESLNSTVLNDVNSILDTMINNTYINATKISYTSYRGQSCIYMRGYIQSNTINWADLISSLSPSAYGTSQTSRQSFANDTVSFGGPYSMCISPSSGVSYNVSANITFDFAYSSASAYYGSQTTRINASVDFSYNVSSMSTVTPPLSYISQPPYPVVNGTCSYGTYLQTEDYLNTFKEQYYSCNQVDMNYSGYVRLELMPSSNPFSYYTNSTNTTNNSASKVRIVGVACESYNSAGISFLQSPNGSMFQPTNMTVNSNEAVTLIAKCPSAKRGSEYTGQLYAAVVENTSLGSENLSSAASTFTVLPTISGSLGSNMNTGPIASSVKLSTSSFYNYTSNYNYTFNTTVPTTTIYYSGYTTTIPNAAYNNAPNYIQSTSGNITFTYVNRAGVLDSITLGNNSDDVLVNGGSDNLTIIVPDENYAQIVINSNYNNINLILKTKLSTGITIAGRDNTITITNGNAKLYFFNYADYNTVSSHSANVTTAVNEGVGNNVS